MHSDVLGSAHDPLLPLTRWIQYTQTELQSVRADLIHHREEEFDVRRLQQSQLDSLQVQIRELAQQQTEFSEQMTEVANAVTDMFHQLGVLRNTFNQAMNDMLRHLKAPSSCRQHKWLLHNQKMPQSHKTTSDFAPAEAMQKSTAPCCAISYFHQS